MTTDETYLGLADHVLTHGRRKHNRTGIDTIGVFGTQARYSIDNNAFPILTTKKVFFKAIVHELIWFLSGDTNIKYLVDNDIRIWNEWTYKKYKETPLPHIQPMDKVSRNGITWDPPEIKYLVPPWGRVGYSEPERPAWDHFTMDEFVNAIKTNVIFAQEWGDLGYGTYGSMWRDFPLAKFGLKPDLGTDQIIDVIKTLNTDPDSRRMIVSAWHPELVKTCALPPCHMLFQFNTEELTIEERREVASFNFKKDFKEHKNWNELTLDFYNIPKRRLNSTLIQRSCDLFLGVPFNITSYCLLTSMIAQCVNMVPGEFVHTMNDLHIYENHINQIKLQMTRKSKSYPELKLNKLITNIFDFKYDDIQLDGYDPHPLIKGEVAV